MAGAEVAGAELAGAELAGAELAGAELAGAELAGAELAGAELAGAELAGAELAGAELAGAELAGAGAGRSGTGRSRSGRDRGRRRGHGVTGAVADVTVEVTGAVAEVTVDGSGIVAACACRENTSKTARIPAAKIATCIARRAMCRAIGCGMSSSHPTGKIRTRPECPPLRARNAQAQYIQAHFVTVTRNLGVCGVVRKRTCCTPINVQ